MERRSTREASNSSAYRPSINVEPASSIPAVGTSAEARRRFTRLASIEPPPTGSKITRGRAPLIAPTEVESPNTGKQPDVRNRSGHRRGNKPTSAKPQKNQAEPRSQGTPGPFPNNPRPLFSPPSPL